MTELTVACTPEGDGWCCAVSVEQGASRTDHVVTIQRADRDRLAGPDGEPHLLVNASFRFLLEREPKESILRHFAIADIERYFPEYPAEIGRRLAPDRGA